MENSGNGLRRRMGLFAMAMGTAFILLMITLVVEHFNRTLWASQPMDAKTLWVIVGNFQGLGYGLLKAMKPEERN